MQELTESLTDSLWSEQKALELRAVEFGMERYEIARARAERRGEGASMIPARRFVQHWLLPVTEAIRQDIRECKAGKPGPGRAQYGSMIIEMDPERVALVGIHEMLCTITCQDDHAARYALLAARVGRALVAQYHMEKLRRAAPDDLKAVNRKSKRGLTVENVNHLAHQMFGRYGDTDTEGLRVAFGGMVVSTIATVAAAGPYDVEDVEPAFAHDLRMRDGKTHGWIVMSPIVSDAIEDGHALRARLRPWFPPMLMQPMPWNVPGETGDRFGGYLTLPTQLVKRACPEQSDLLATADQTRIRAAVDAVSSTPWQVNTGIAEIVDDAWQEYDDLPSLPSRDQKELPPKPADMDTNPEARKAWKAKARAIYDENMQNNGDRVNAIRLLDTARELAGRDIWFPHQLDWRGRCYAIPPHLNYQGNDLSRGLLQFSERRRLGERGWWWLRVHLANLAGLDKASFAARVDAVDAAHDDIMRSAKDGVTPRSWWLNQDDKPWQLLAACREYANAVECGPEDYESGLPIQMDGTCNGLQHYAALGCDPLGAAAVNMTPSDAPSDVYTKVAASVAMRVGHDVDGETGEIARLLDGHIKRKVVKQVVMTSVYGVTRHGATDQVRSQIADLPGLEGPALLSASRYLSGVTLEGIGDVCKGASDVMAWFRTCAREIVHQLEPVSWVSPIGLPVVQPYREHGTRTIRTLLQTVSVSYRDDFLPLKNAKQIQSAAPNIIHSIDASHMLATATRAREAGMAFAAVHDSYWTHAADVDRLGAMLREEFVRIHERELLMELAEGWRKSVPEADIPDPPKGGGWDVREVLHAPYFFS